MNRRGVWVVMLLTALLVVMPKAWGQRPPETHPVSATQNIVMSWDRSAMPGDVVLMPPRTLLGYDHTNLSLQYGALHLVCLSDSDATRGACPTDNTNEHSLGLRDIRLTFTESRSQMRTELSIRGGVERALSGRSCLGNFWQNGIFAPWTGYGTACAFDEPAGTGAQLSLGEAELRKLVAGVWSAKLELSVQTPGARNLAVQVYTFDLTITDRNAVSIYFPAFHHVTPLVQLNSDYDPIRQTVGGRTSLEMCLYDGLGSQAQYLGVTVRDRSGKPPGPSGYSLWHTDGGSDDTRRLDYTVTLDHNGAPVSMPNGVEQQLHGIDTAQLRLVLLPGMSQPVFCVPTPITFDIPRVPISTQQAGTYFGELQVELRVPTVTP
ncbi:MAG: CfaE/CblD family pilus tip adhesin [Stenotrophomonas sp.]